MTGNHLIIGVCIPNAETSDPTARGVRLWAVDADAAEKLWRLSETLTGARIGD
jgi:hypothetical protein